ncbi:Malonyl-CoA decarboxylase [Herbaspirillum sp. HC18]|nr:Malonyl-CoA decarboxylase [Herbaspirillum sp. HC18]
MLIDTAINAAPKARESTLLSGARNLFGRLFGKHEPQEGGRHLSQAELKNLRQRFTECASERGGVVSARQRAAEIGQIYAHLNDDGRREFLRLLALEFGPDQAAVEAALRNWTHAGDIPVRSGAETALREALRSPRSKILTQFNAIPNGVKFLVEMRDDMLRFLKDAPELGVIESELYALLSAWFDVDFLQLQRISWNSSAALLEKLIKYEAVHQIRSWNDLRNRLDSDRRCYGLFHPRMPDEPLIFVEVALTDRLSDNIQVLLDESLPPLEPGRANTAIFYSISNTQPGLRGLNFGNFLIKRVVDDLSRDFPQLKTFSTLSPIPGFTAWLKKQEDWLSRLRELQAGGEPLREKWQADVAGCLASGAWQPDAELASVIQPLMLEACAHYLAREKSEALPRDPVARFHLVNGARIERINWLADTSDKGWKQSAGMMVNYLYRKGDLESNHEKLMLKGEIAASRTVRGLLQE